jgi:hypothetical protein
MANVFSDKQLNALNMAMTKVVEKIITPMQMVLTEEEFIDGFIYPDHIDKLREATRMTGISAPVGAFQFTAHAPDGEEVKLQRYGNGTRDFMLPIYVSQGLRQDAPAGLRERLGEWIVNRLAIGNAMNEVHGAVNTLNYCCTSARTIAVLVPCLPLLVSMMYYSDNTGKTEASIKAADKLEKPGTMAGMPLLSRDDKNKLLDASLRITSSFALLSEMPIPTMKKYDHLISMTGRTKVLKRVLGGSRIGYHNPWR